MSGIFSSDSISFGPYTISRQFFCETNDGLFKYWHNPSISASANYEVNLNTQNPLIEIWNFFLFLFLCIKGILGLGLQSNFNYPTLIENILNTKNDNESIVFSFWLNGYQLNIQETERPSSLLWVNITVFFLRNRRKTRIHIKLLEF